MVENRMKVFKISMQRQRMKNNLPPLPTLKKVCAYCRVSTCEEAQVSSYELQVAHYTEFIKNNLNWTFKGIYGDYGKSGTSIKERTEFLRMIKDCKVGKIDLVITKSISRFARNTLDCLNYVRVLRSLTPPVGVYFEKENIDTLDAKSELLLTILSSLAQDESRSISENLKWSVQKRFQAGEARCPTKFLLGYDKDKDGNLIINEEEAVTVSRIYREYMEGKGALLIGKELKDEGVITARGTANWGKNSIIHILHNERYCGDVLMQKGYTANYLTHRQKRNKGEMPQYFIENHHPAIIPREEWNDVQTEIKRRYELATLKDSNMRQGYSNTSVISNHLFCSKCGQPVIRASAILKGGGRNEKISVWRCRATSQKASRERGYERCYAKRQQDLKLKEAFMEMLFELKDRRFEMVVNGHYDNLIKILDSIENRYEFRNEYFRELIDRGVVYDEGKIEYTFKCGIICTSYIKLDRGYHESKTKVESNT